MAGIGPKKHSCKLHQSNFQYPFKISRSQVMPLVASGMEKVLAFSGGGDYCSPARTGMLCYSDECVSCSVCSGSWSSPGAEPQFASSSSCLHSYGVCVGEPQSFALVAVPYLKSVVRDIALSTQPEISIFWHMPWKQHPMGTKNVVLHHSNPTNRKAENLNRKED